MLRVTEIIARGLGTPYRESPESEARMRAGTAAHAEIAESLGWKSATGPYGALALEIVRKLDLPLNVYAIEGSLQWFISGVGHLQGHPDLVIYPVSARAPADIIEWKTTSYLDSPVPSLVWAAQVGAYRQGLDRPGRQWVVRLTDSEYRISELDSHYIAQCWEHACTAYRLALASDEEAS